ncbi:MAG TPA: bifunctional UDP-N-acetylglucosamine diphosphorylase/glucosamine-1-phosphate N-acetyltransferase GlmU [Candidatus Eremiobacteraceae bacterium]
MSASARAIVLAAGKGTRMKSRTPKVLHELCGRTMLAHVLKTVGAAGASDVLAVINPELREACAALGIASVVQEPQLGTGHAMQLAMAAVRGDDLPVLVVSADMPLLTAELLEAVVAARAVHNAPLAMVTAHVPLPTNFGRIVRQGGRVMRIVENADCTLAERSIDEVNAGVYCFDSSTLRRHLAQLKPNNKQGELYVTDCIAAIVDEGGRIDTVDSEDRRLVMGVNNRVELAAARAVMQESILQRHMLAGVTVVDPASTYVGVDVTIEPDVTILPQSHLMGATGVARGSVLGPSVQLDNAQIGEECVIRWSVIKDSTVGAHVTIGPFAHLRDGAVVEDGAHIGNFVELKKTRMGRGAKAGHLAYLGDATLGAKVNIGAGTITCNYDGTTKHATEIGEGAFIGSNSSLVAPVKIGAGAKTGAGSVVTHDVPPGEQVAGVPARPMPKKTKR